MIPAEPEPVDPSDEAYWAGIRAQYGIAQDFINLENGFFSMPSQPVLDAMQRYQAWVNREASYFMRNRFPQRLAAVVEALAEFTGASPEELIITRNATESMNILIQGYPFNADDEVIISNQDYDHVLSILEMMQDRQRLKLACVRLPFHPQDDDEIVALYEAAITPKTRVLLLTHLTHRTGLILPVAKIAHMARMHGVDVFVDAAHSFAHIDYRLPDLGGCFAAANLHKWLGAPLGVGLLYIRKERIADIAPLFGETAYGNTDIRKLAHFGTTPPAAIMAIEDAIAFHHRIGSRNKEERLRYLKDYWVSRVQANPRIEMLTPERSCAIAAFRMQGIASQEVVDSLFEQHRIFSVTTHIDGESIVRITPHLYNSIEDLDRLVGALMRFTEEQ